MPLFIIASIIALEHGAQQVWRRTVFSPIGACISCFFLAISFLPMSSFTCHVELVETSLQR
jgi:hypothetical protein